MSNRILTPEEFHPPIGTAWYTVRPKDWAGFGQSVQGRAPLPLAGDFLLRALKGKSDRLLLAADRATLKKGIDRICELEKFKTEIGSLEDHLRRYRAALESGQPVPPGTVTNQRDLDALTGPWNREIESIKETCFRPVLERVCERAKVCLKERAEVADEEERRVFMEWGVQPQGFFKEAYLSAAEDLRCGYRPTEGFPNGELAKYGVSL